MLELGQWAEALHREVGEYAAASGIDVLIGVRGAAEQMVRAARAAGVEAQFFSGAADAGRALRAIAQAGDVVLFKRIARHARGDGATGVCGGGG